MNILTRAISSVFVLAAALLALDPNSLKPQGYVSDFARVLNAQSRAQLEEYCGRVEQATGVQMAIVTLPSLEGEPIEDFTNSLYRKWGVGKKGKDEGVMLLLAIQDRRDRIEVGYGLEPILPDGFAGSVLRQAQPLLRQGNYGAALFAAADEMGMRIAAAKNVSLNFALQRPIGRAVPVRTGLPLPLIVIGIIVLLLIMRGGGGGFFTGLLLGNLLGRGSGGGGWGGGGFGGYDSGGGGGGGGFGGFGGGDSGGGGASGGW